MRFCPPPIMNTQDFAVGFRGVDQTSDPESYIRFLGELGRLDSIRAFNGEMFPLMQP